MYGRELILDLHGCARDQMTPEALREFCVRLCDDVLKMTRADFHIWGDDPDDDFTDRDPKTIGTTCIQFIETSNITIHTIWPQLTVYLNIFSCRDFDPDMVEQFCFKHFCADSAWRHDVIRTMPGEDIETVMP